MAEANGGRNGNGRVQLITNFAVPVGTLVVIFALFVNAGRDVGSLIQTVTRIEERLDGIGRSVERIDLDKPDRSEVQAMIFLEVGKQIGSLEERLRRVEVINGGLGSK